MKKHLSALLLLLLLVVAAATVSPTLAAQEALDRGDLTTVAVKLPSPEYPTIARRAGAEGRVTAEVVVDENGKVTSVNVLNGHQLLRGAALKAARQAEFAPFLLEGKAVKFKGTLTYNFVKTP